uniref:Uncharacterized protein n=1 Tax=Physcomitrium patens TaxID=3218 RepID=A0A2K1JI25_PHYPA|nr:hypothetical protein PHYPA_018615 [Physcomitrium patens]
MEDMVDEIVSIGTYYERERKGQPSNRNWRYLKGSQSLHQTLQLLSIKQSFGA